MNTVNPVILLVDDSEDILDYLSQDLTGKYEVLHGDGRV